MPSYLEPKPDPLLQKRSNGVLFLWGLLAVSLFSSAVWFVVYLVAKAFHLF